MSRRAARTTTWCWRPSASPRDFAAEGFAPRDHLELGTLLGAIDVERGAKVSGSRFYYLTGVGAELELALVNLAMSMAIGNGFTPMIPPALVKPAAMEGTGFLGQAAKDVYHLEADDLYLVGTAEVPLAAYHSEEILDAGSLPRRYAGFSPSYRREAGAHGKDTRGIFRVHWFDKVEMFSFTAPEEADAEHQRLLAWEKEFITALEVPFQVLELAAGDLGLSAARKYDCYGWLPSQDRYREITSTSNCTEFQARRLNIRARFPGGTGPVATLNGTLCAMTRTIIMILENHQQADGIGTRTRGAASLPRWPRGADPALMAGSAKAAWRPRLVALDVDGTLVDRDGRLPTAVGRGDRPGGGSRGAGGAVHRALLARRPSRWSTRWACRRDRRSAPTGR